jgi:N-acetyl-gamma-glutamyl-phosphate reductase
MKLGLKAKITFVPHLVPMVRGILSTCYAELVRPINKEEVKDLYSDFYRGEPFIRVVANSPHTKLTRGTNLCLVYPSVDPRAQRLIVVSALDNLVKGAAGQAVQNMNLILGITETTGLQEMVIYP